MIVLNKPLLAYLDERLEQKDPEVVELNNKMNAPLDGIQGKAADLGFDIEETTLRDEITQFRHRSLRFNTKDPKDPFQDIVGRLTLEPNVSSENDGSRFNILVTIRGKRCFPTETFNPFTRCFETFTAVKRNVLRTYEVSDVKGFIDGLDNTLGRADTRYFEQIDYGDEAYLYFSKRFTDAVLALPHTDPRRKESNFEYFVNLFDSTVLSGFKDVVGLHDKQRFDIYFDLVEKDQKRMLVFYLFDTHLEEVLTKTEIDFDNFFSFKRDDGYYQKQTANMSLEKLFRHLGDLRDPNVLARTMQVIEDEIKRKSRTNRALIGELEYRFTMSEDDGKLTLTYNAHDYLKNSFSQTLDINYDASIIHLYNHAMNLNATILFYLKSHQVVTTMMKCGKETLPRFKLVYDMRPQVDILEIGLDREERVGVISFQQGKGYHLALYMGVGDQERHVYSPYVDEIFNFMKTLSERKSEYVGFTPIKDIGSHLHRGLIQDRYFYRVEEAFFDKVLIMEKTEEGSKHQWVTFEEFQALRSKPRMDPDQL